jgi:hypothetical protein
MGENRMRAVLVVDVDDDMIGEVDYTVLNKKEMVNGRAELRPLPNRKEDLHYPCNEYLQAVNEGWNACLDEITGETE